MANLVNNLPLLPEDKVNLEILLEQTNNDLNSAWRVIFALQESVTQIILDLIDGLVRAKIYLLNVAIYERKTNYNLTWKCLFFPGN